MARIALLRRPSKDTPIINTAMAVTCFLAVPLLLTAFSYSVLCLAVFLNTEYAGGYTPHRFYWVESGQMSEAVLDALGPPLRVSTAIGAYHTMIDPETTVERWCYSRPIEDYSAYAVREVLVESLTGHVIGKRSMLYFD